MIPSFTDINALYVKIKSQVPTSIGSSEFSENLCKLGKMCINYLSICERKRLISKVPNKEYFAFKLDREMSRPIRQDLFSKDVALVDGFCQALVNNNFSSLSSEQINIVCYSISIGFCAVIDLNKSRDQKTPGTFFEYLAGHCFSVKLNCSPSKRLEVLNLDRRTTLPTDFVFDLGPCKPKFHLPVKTSTRERVIQVWAHQRVLDGVYGTGRFWGTLVSLAETKLNRKNLEVVEICLPEQWRLYQLFIAQLKRIYYLDVPEKYLNLANEFPQIPVKSFGEFFSEVDDLNNF